MYGISSHPLPETGRPPQRPIGQQISIRVQQTKASGTKKARTSSISVIYRKQALDDRKEDAKKFFAAGENTPAPRSHGKMHGYRQICPAKFENNLGKREISGTEASMQWCFPAHIEP
jgi:hypothetical protein